MPWPIGQLPIENMLEIGAGIPYCWQRIDAAVSHRHPSGPIEFDRQQ